MGMLRAIVFFEFRILVASPTGSTAYSMACGGSIVHPEIDALLLTSLNSMSLSSRPLIVPGNSLIRLKVNFIYLKKYFIFRVIKVKFFWKVNQVGLFKPMSLFLSRNLNFHLFLFHELFLLMTGYMTLVLVCPSKNKFVLGKITKLIS